MGESKPTHSEACCEYCGRPLAPCVVEFGARRIVAGFRECDCEGARGQRARAERMEAAKREARLAERRKRAGIPKRFLGATVQHQDLIDYLESFEGSAGRGLYIYGSVGRGKSYSAAALANAFVDAGYRTVFTTASAMLETRYAACDVLVLDDLGKEDAKEWSSNMMFLVINARYENMRPTIFTSNYSPQALSKRLGRKGETETAEAIASRLSETTIPIHLTGPDMRIASRM
ncbi:ATP-binding protein [Gordonibacter urolithinfaciens]|uniref:ATP-binding protein n=1 Tax=Gordonibacter urolithinfaciens TaxID=1335613 RepID=UPI000B36A0E8|nr:ATP-binding protein [Gordonibacter urolithinfaciens]OUO88163.1 ATP-binding protein [Gordonibacter urolithinfaciens]